MTLGHLYRFSSLFIEYVSLDFSLLPIHLLYFQNDPTENLNFIFAFPLSNAITAFPRVHLLMASQGIFRKEKLTASLAAKGAFQCN